MSLWTMIFLLAIAGIAFAAWRHQQDYRHGIVRDDRGRIQRMSNGREDELQAEIEQLRERLEVLERIATDDRESRRLAAEIEELRDQQDQQSTEHQPTGRGE